jgi:hypothetical protein
VPFHAVLRSVTYEIICGKCTDSYTPVKQKTEINASKTSQSLLGTHQVGRLLKWLKMFPSPEKPFNVIYTTSQLYHKEATYAFFCSKVSDGEERKPLRRTKSLKAGLSFGNVVKYVYVCCEVIPYKLELGGGLVSEDTNEPVYSHAHDNGIPVYKGRKSELTKSETREDKTGGQTNSTQYSSVE